MAISDVVFGKPLATSEERAEQIGVAAGIPIFGLDALTSAAYGPEAAMALLIPLGIASTDYIIPIISSILILLVIRVFQLSPDDCRISKRRRLVYSRDREPGRKSRSGWRPRR